MNILIVKLSAIGDVVMSLPFLEAMRGRYPRAHITWLVEEAAADLVREHPLLDRVLVSRRKYWFKNVKSGRLPSTWREASGFLKELRDREYDLVVDLQGLFKSGILSFLSGGRRRVGFDGTREFSYLFLNERLAPYDPDRHALLRYLDVARYLGAETGEEVLWSFPVNQAASEKAGRLLGKTDGPLVAINPGAKWDTKLWPAAYWRELTRLMVEAGGVNLVLTGSRDEMALNADLVDGTAGIKDLTGHTDLKVLAEVFRAVDLVICPDTGPMHLAAAVGAKVLAVFGPTAPWRTGPFGPGHTILRTSRDCSPCFKKQCNHTACMKEIKPEEVARSAWALIRKDKVEDPAH
jgi:lipopolysaccharide heptosyltransferase I